MLDLEALEINLQAILFVGANALNTPPGVYDRKVETQRNWRELLQAVEHVV